MTIEMIKEKLKRTATVYETGGFRPTNQLLESWIGKVAWKKEGEELPVDIEGNTMNPLATLFFQGMAGVPDSLSDVYLCTVFVSTNIFGHEQGTEGYFEIRTYKEKEELIPCDWNCKGIKAFPLKPRTVDNDYPAWDGGGIPDDIFDEILKLEEAEDIEYYEDIYEELYTNHKIGGYPAYIQPGGWEEDYQFVFQISSDEKAGLNIVDSGSFYFFYSKEKNLWDVQYDFY